MNIDKDSLVNFGALAISQLLPEGKLKELLRKNYYRRYNPFYSLEQKLSKVELVESDILFVELDNGMKFYGLKDETPFLPLRSKYSFSLKYGEPKKLSQMKVYLLFGCFFQILHQIIYEGRYQRYWQLKRGDIVVDIGAQVGVFSVKVAKIVGDGGKVIAIEPEPRNFALLLKNIQANGLENVIPVQEGIWSTKDKLKLHLSKYPYAHSFYEGDLWGSADKGEFVVVEVDSLDNILEKLGIKEVDFIKMNIEGSEVEALMGMEEALANDVKLAIADHSIKGESTRKTITPWLRRRGFEVYYKEGLVYARKGASF